MSWGVQTRCNVLVWVVLLTSCGGSSVAASAAKTADAGHAIVLRGDSPERRINPQDFELSIGGRHATVLSVMDSSEAHLSIALVIDAGRNQYAVLEREKQLASCLITEFSDSPTAFIVVRGGHRAAKIVDTFKSQVAIDAVNALATDTGKKSLIPIYQAVALAIDELSSHAGIRVLIVVAEGNDFRSGISYKQLLANAEEQHVSITTALVADHSTRGSKAIFSYGWDLESLAGDTAGIFVENDRNTSRVVSRLTRMIGSLRLVTFEVDSLLPGRHRVSTSSSSVGRLHSQKAIVIENAGDQFILGKPESHARIQVGLAASCRKTDRIRQILELVQFKRRGAAACLSPGLHIVHSHRAASVGDISL